jgi:hypothetical protein
MKRRVVPNVYTVKFTPSRIHKPKYTQFPTEALAQSLEYRRYGRNQVLGICQYATNSVLCCQPSLSPLPLANVACVAGEEMLSFHLELTER